jgi:hypothetical protein
MSNENFKPAPILNSEKLFPILYLEKPGAYYKEWRFGGIPKRLLDTLVLGVPYFIHETDTEKLDAELNPFSQVKIHALIGYGWEWNTVLGWKSETKSKEGIDPILRTVREQAKKPLLTDQAVEQLKSLEKSPSPFSHQVGGSHYKQYAIQPYEFFFKNNIPHHKAAIIRRILRYDHPTGKGLEDLEKIKHEVDLIIELENLK